MIAQLTEIYATYTCPKGHETGVPMGSLEIESGNIPTTETCEECEE